jgi:hypothetical protein
MTVTAQYTLLPDASLPPSTGQQPLFVAPGARLTPLGSDLAGVLSLDYALTTVIGRQALAQAILRRLTQARGGLVGSPAYGYDVTALIGATVPEQLIEQRVMEQVVAEEEVEDASCTATLTRNQLRIEVSVIDADGPFELTLTADELTVEAFVDGFQIFQQAA